MIANTPNKSNKALFLDRDGVVIEYIPYLSHPDQIKIPVGAGETLKQWQDAGYLLIIITNQSGIARNYFTMSDVEAVHRKIREEYAKFKVYFHDIFVCPHQPSDHCKCRKPSPYMVMEAAQKHLIELSQSFFIGDAISDIDCAINAGCHPILVLTNRTLITANNIQNQQVTIRMINELKETVPMIKV